MEVMVIVAHPYEKSFNHALYQTVIKSLQANHHHVYAHHLYNENFNPLLEGTELANGKTEDPVVMQHREEIKKVEGIIIIHPNWWGQPPAILKGWMDRVFPMDF